MMYRPGRQAMVWNVPLPTTLVLALLMITALPNRRPPAALREQKENYNPPPIVRQQKENAVNAPPKQDEKRTVQGKEVVKGSEYYKLLRRFCNQILLGVMTEAEHKKNVLEFRLHPTILPNYAATQRCNNNRKTSASEALLTGKELLDEVVEILYLDLSLIDIHRTVKSVKHVNRQLSDDAMEVEDEESDDEGDSCKKSGHKRFWLQRIKPHLCLEELDDESADKKDVIDAHKFWDLNVASVYGLFF
eukprot:515322_1